MTGKDFVVAWLNDAYAMEKGLVQILESQIGDAKNYPTVQNGLQQHLEQTKQHAEIVKGCVERLGGSTSSIKSGLASLFGQVQGMSTGAAQDKVIKDALADFGAENFEVASYTALIDAARALGDEQTASACEQIRAQDQAMADWIKQNLGAIVTDTLQTTTSSAS